jgi:uncharacterized protein
MSILFVMAKQYCFSVRGTTCASCEVVIEREIRELDGVIGIDASHARGEVRVDVIKGRVLEPSELSGILGTHGYRFAFADQPVERERWNLKRIGGALLVVTATYLILDRIGFLTFSPTVESSSGFVGVFLIGLIASVSSCTAVLSGLVVAVSASTAKKGGVQSKAQKMRPHLIFNVGRLAGFVFFGAIIGLIGSLIQLSPAVNGFMILLVALLMVALGINLLEIIPKGISVLRPPKWLSHKIHDLSSSHHPNVSFVLGALTFFLPCGFTQAIQLYALSLGDMKSSAMLLGVFALGTLPALLGIGAITSSATGARLKRMTQIAGVLVLSLGFSNLQNSFALLDWHPFSFASSGYTMDTSTLSIVDGEQVIQMEISERGIYIPASLTVVKDVPVRWEIFGADFMGCADSLVMRAFGVQEQLDAGQNVVNFTPTKTGDFTYSCSMGMIRGTMHVVANDV